MEDVVLFELSEENRARHLRPGVLRYNHRFGLRIRPRLDLAHRDSMESGISAMNLENFENKTILFLIVCYDLNEYV